MFRLTCFYLWLTVSIIAECVTGSATINPERYYRRLVTGQIEYPAGYEQRPGYVLDDYHPAHKYAAISARGLQALATMEFKMYERIKDLNATLATTTLTVSGKPLGANQTDFIQAMQEYLEDFESISLPLMNQRQEIVHNNVMNSSEESILERAKIPAANPNAVFRMIRRVRHYFRRWMNKPREKDALPQQHYLYRYLQRDYNPADGPTLPDLHTAMIAIIALQYKLDMDTTDVATGNFRGTRTGAVLRAVDCIEIGCHAVASGFYAIGVEYLEEAVAKVQSGSNTSMSIPFVLDLLQKAKITHDKEWEKAQEPKLKFFHKPLKTVSSPAERRWGKRQFLKDFCLPILHVGGRIEESEEIKLLRHGGVCKGEMPKTESETARLFCWYESAVHPAWKIGPLKVELLSRHRSPGKLEVVHFHDVLLGDEGIRTVLDSALLNYSTHGTRAYDPLHDLSSSEKLRPEQTGMYRRLAQLFERVTGLKYQSQKTAARGLRMFQFAPGGVADPHYETLSISVETLDVTQGFATMLLYLAEPEKGGETAFTYSGTVIKPLKGSASFWYNVNGAGDILSVSYHGTCPILLGHKATLAFWPLYEDQNQLKCDLDKEHIEEVLVNGKTKYGRRVKHPDAESIAESL